MSRADGQLRLRAIELGFGIDQAAGGVGKEKRLEVIVIIIKDAAVQTHPAVGPAGFCPNFVSGEDFRIKPDIADIRNVETISRCVEAATLDATADTGINQVVVGYLPIQLDLARKIRNPSG